MILVDPGSPLLGAARLVLITPDYLKGFSFEDAFKPDTEAADAGEKLYDPVRLSGRLDVYLGFFGML